MKKRTLFACGLAAALFAGCSSDDVTVDNGKVGPNEVGYLALNISLPTTSGGSRADTGNNATNQDNEKTEAGITNEYKVDNIHIVCLSDAGEVLETIPVASANLGWNTSADAGITTEKLLPVTKVQGTTKKILVLINKPAALSIADGTMWDSGSGVKAYETTLTSTTDLTGSGSSFFMTNSPLAKGDAATTTLLVNVDVYNTEAEAMANVKTVNVERAVGKVSMSHKTESPWASTYDDWTYTLNTTGYSGDKIQFTNWILDNTNKKTYFIRHYNPAWENVKVTGTGKPYNNQRFRGESTTYTGNSGNEYRTYWAEDPNYDIDLSGSALDDNFKTYNADEFGTNCIGMNVSSYCLENTFNVNHMIGNQTTRALIKGTYTPDGFTSGETWYRIGNSVTALKAKKTGASDPDGLKELIAAALTAHSQPNAGVEFNETNIIAGVIAISTEDENLATMRSYFSNLDANDTNAKNQLDAIKKDLGGSITVFKKGECFYAVKIQHFGQSYTPWGDETDAFDFNGTKYYDYITNDVTGEDNYYLGRYGIVRNNWYELELGSVSAPGSPTIPAPSADADDEQKYYIQAKVKIMDWAVRKQSVAL